MKRLSIKALALAAISAAAFVGCTDESSLYEEINPDALRVTSLYKLKSLTSEKCAFKLSVSATVVSAGDNFESGYYAIEDGDIAQDGMLVKVSDGSKFSFGEKVSIYLDGTTISQGTSLITMTVPDGQITSEGTGSVTAIPITASLLAGGTYQSQYVSLEGWQVIEEDLDKTWGDGLTIETKEKDSLKVYVLPSASFANSKPASGSGKISGVVGYNDGEYVIMPQSTDDIEFTDARIVVNVPNRAAIVWTDGSNLTAYVSEVSTNEIEGAKKLSGAANCFVVSAAGTYSFDAKAADGNYPAGIEEGTVIYFKVAKTGGNTVVCYLSPADGSTILWTWHIWAAGTETSKMEVTKNGVTMLDRLVGATSVTPGSVGAIGLYYQWGRKDPMAGVNTTGVGDDTEDMSLDYVDGVKGFPGAATAKGTVNTQVAAAWAGATFSGKTHQDAAALPTTYLTGYTFADALYPEAVTWDAAADPCPAGYTVPSRTQSATFFGTGADIFAAMYNADGTTAGMDVTTNFGCTLSGYGIWFPNNGNRARAEGRAVSLGRRHFSWDNERSGNNGYIIRLCRAASDCNTEATFAKGNATGVRCVKK